MKNPSTLIVTGLMLMLFISCEVDGGDGGWFGDDDAAAADVITQEQDIINNTGYPTLGKSCDQYNACAGDLLCLPYPYGKVCAQRCDTSTPYCADGSHCIALVGLVFGACAAHGQGGYGAQCDNKLDCQKSLACFTDTLAGGAVCKYTCDFNETQVPCPTGWSCTITTGGVDFGLCVQN